MELVILALIIVAIVIIVKASKKAKNKKIQEQFRANLQKEIRALENDNDYFEEHYNCIMKEIGEITKPEIDSVLRRIPQLKTQFSSVCEKLLQLSEKNVCLTCNQQILDVVEETSFFPETKERISNDMMELLPVLGDYFDLHKQFHEEIYENVLMKKMHRTNSLAFGFLTETADEYASPEDFHEKVDACLKFILFNYEILADRLICQTLNLSRSVDVRNSKVKEIKELVDITNEKEFHKTFVYDIWFPKMQSIGKKYAEAHVDLYNYFKGINSRLEAQIDWFSIHYFHPPVGGILYLKEYTKEECNRILRLYQEGKIKGRNSFMN
ncbi:MAG: hypothetical protein IJD74_01615 [Clostridia bacterium]|nr:hypothetical protein [Clostridia bacterium]